MIIDKQPLPDDPTPEDAPPAYDYPSSSSFVPPPPEKDAGPSTTSPTLSPSPSSSSRLSPPLVSKKPSSKGKGRWFPSFGQSKAAKEVEKTVMNLVRDVVKVPDAAAISVLRNCEEACNSHSLSFAALLQEQTIEGHSAIYWAIIKRPRDLPGAAGLELVQTMLAMAAPLSAATISEIRLACLQASDEALFQRLRHTPAFSPLSGKDEILLGANIPPDDISVSEVAGNQGEFVAVFRIPQFQRRMRVTKQVTLEFIARGRMWCLAFLESDGISCSAGEKGAWVVSLSLMEHSPPTWIDSHLLIDDTRGAPSTPSSSKASAKSFMGMPASKAPPQIELRLKTSSQLAPPSANRHHDFVRDISLPLRKSPMGDSLQFDGCTFIAPDGTLTAKLEARLAKPDNECIIC
ncbi:hypothetical protein PsYK624_144200 [Phanerochaete sordida]|uniref:Uncharacterized protein n=1 Tax=Phanerochaete sordida TaxID=48140 RepID=A0A9P3GML5_9APHY|nr:hypothetical protein PsYK624_144200 [Phanerochaete sordida]